MAVVWKFGLCDLAGVNIGEVVNAYDRTLNLPLNGNPTAQFRIRLDDPLADEIISRNGDCLVKVYQTVAGTPTLRFIGDILTVEEGGPVKDGEGVSITVTAAGPLWRLSKRLLGIPYPGVNPNWSSVEADEIIRQWLDQVNANSDTGIREGTFDVLYETDFGPAYLKPMSEGLIEMQASKVPPPVGTPAVYTARDDFTLNPGLLHLALTDGDGTQWDCDDTAVGLGMVVYDPGNYAYRNGGVGSDPSYATGAWCVSGTGNHGSVLVGVDYQLAAGYSSGPNLYAGVFARYVDQDHWLLAFIDLQSNALLLRKKNGAGTDVSWETFTFSPGGIAASTRYAIRLKVDDGGNYAVWHWAPGSGDAGDPIIQGRDSALSSTGALATGKVGFYDCLTTATASDRNYYNFFAQADPTPQSFDFEIAPIEPTADVAGYPGTLPVIGTMNISYQIGTSKPEVIFEYGSGNRSSKGYKRIIDRNGLVNIAYVLPEGFEGGVTTAGELALASDQIAIDARGTFEEVVPADFGDSQLRQALAESHVNVRKIPRHVITFEPSENANVFGTDFIVGDFVTGRATVMVNGVKTTRFNALFRVYGVEISVNDEGKADVVPSLVPA